MYYSMWSNIVYHCIEWRLPLTCKNKLLPQAPKSMKAVKIVVHCNYQVAEGEGTECECMWGTFRSEHKKPLASFSNKLHLWNIKRTVFISGTKVRITKKVYSGFAVNLIYGRNEDYER